MEQKEDILSLPIIPENTIIAGKYAVGERIAETDFSIIYNGTSKGTEERVIIKTPNETSIKRARDENNPILEDIIKQAFYKEGIILGSLNHPGIPKSYGNYPVVLPSKKKIKARIMEYVPSHLDVFFTNKPFLKAASEFIAQFAEILGYLQDNGIVHSDIKPQNIMCKKDKIKLIDFNIASQCATALKVTRLENVTKPQSRYRAMTEAYAPPEIKHGEGPVYASDIYSFGKVLEDMVIAYGEKDFSILNYKNSSKTYDKGKVIQLMLSMPMALVDIYSKCTHPNIEERIELKELKHMARKLTEEVKSPIYASL